MERHNTGGEILPAGVFPTVGVDRRGKLLLVGPCADGFRKVLVGLRVGGKYLGQRRHSTWQVFLVHGAESWDDGGGELVDHKAPAGLGHTRHFAQAGLEIMDVAQPVGDGHRVEGVVGKRKVHRVADHLGHLTVLAGGQHALGEVARHDPRAGFTELDGGHGGACGEVEHLLPWFEFEAFAGASSPVFVQPERQHGVRLVVVLAHVVEHSGNVEGLFLQIRLGHGWSVYFGLLRHPQK